jgi:hypothetical protein
MTTSKGPRIWTLSFPPLRILLCDHAAGDAVAGISGGIGFIVVGFGVDDDGCATVGEERMRVAAEIYVLVLKLCAGLASGVDGEVSHVTGVMTLGVIESVFFAVGIEVRTGGFEVGAIALGILMEVDGVFARRKAVEMKLKRDTGSLRRENDRAYGFTLRVFEFYRGFGGAGQRG